MGARCSRRATSPTHPQFTDFQIIRSIGRGSFGKVCIAQYRGSKQLYALKYMNKQRCVRHMVAESILREIDLLAHISHPFIVNLWFAFQDERYMYMASDLLLGGDLRYHLNQQGRFAEDRAKLYVCEIALALNFLHLELIVHRDVKPENILLDDGGHAHLTDFNLATRLAPNTLCTSFSGTRPYMASEILLASLNCIAGYDHRVDWYSLGVCFYEMLMGRRPYEFAAHISSEQVLHVMSENRIALSSHWPSDLISFITSMLRFDVNERIASLAHLSQHRYMERIDMNHVLQRKTAPVFIPRSDVLNCDPTYELEMRIIGTSSNGREPTQSLASPEEINRKVQEISEAFTPYNRQLHYRSDKSTMHDDHQTMAPNSLNPV